MNEFTSLFCPDGMHRGLLVALAVGVLVRAGVGVALALILGIQQPLTRQLVLHFEVLQLLVEGDCAHSQLLGYLRGVVG